MPRLSYDKVASLSGKSLGLPSMSNLARPLVVCGTPRENKTVEKADF